MFSRCLHDPVPWRSCSSTFCAGRYLRDVCLHGVAPSLTICLQCLDVLLLWMQDSQDSFFNRYLRNLYSRLKEKNMPVDDMRQPSWTPRRNLVEVIRKHYKEKHDKDVQITPDYKDIRTGTPLTKSGFSDNMWGGIYSIDCALCGTEFDSLAGH